MDSSIFSGIQYGPSVRIQLAAIGTLPISGRFHEVTVLEISPQQLLFLCEWEIPQSDRVQLIYELMDSRDRLLLQGEIAGSKPWESRMLYIVKLQTDETQKLRITGMLNRMMSRYSADRRIHHYQSPLFGHSRRERRSGPSLYPRK